MPRLVLLVIVALVAGCAKLPQQPPPPAPPAPVAPPDPLAMLSSTARPERDQVRERYRYDRSIQMTDVPGVKYFHYQPEGGELVVGFSLLNGGSERINPAGLRKPGPHREYRFLFPDRARENIHLVVADDVKLSGRFSHDNMFREWHFFPRKQLPTVRSRNGGRSLEVTLPTGEVAEFDAATMEITRGVLQEKPIDFTRNRHARRNPGVVYRGDYLAVTVDQRGEAPRRARVWGRDKLAEVHYPAKYSRACRISPKHLWDQRPKPGDNDPTLKMLHAADESLFALVEKRCGWDLSALRTPSR